jgi:hypothetical protein
VVGDELHPAVSTLLKVGFITLNGRIYQSAADWLGGARSWGEEEALAEEDEQEEAVSLFFRGNVAQAGRERDCAEGRDNVR